MLKSNKSKLRWVGVVVFGIMFMGLQVFVVDAARAEQSQMDILVDLFGDAFVSADEVAAAIEQGFVVDIFAGPTDQNLVFTPVKPCRIHDSRKSCPVCDVFSPGNSREFYVYGTSDIANQGGNPAGCSSPQCDGGTAIGHRLVCRISCQCCRAACQFCQLRWSGAKHCQRCNDKMLL